MRPDNSLASGKERRWPRSVDLIMRRIIDKYPAAALHDPCDCGITCAVIPRAYLQGPDLHLPIEDRDLRDEVVRFLRDNHLPNAAYDGDDGVLIIAECA